jgi:hypothetical protein
MGEFLFLVLFALVFLAPFLLGTFILGWQKKVELKHDKIGTRKYAYVGFSWTYFLFGWLVPIFRGEVGIGLIHLLFTIITFGIFQLIMPFLYNKQYSNRLLEGAWSPNDTEEKNKLLRYMVSD